MEIYIIYTLFHEYCVIDTRRKLENALKYLYCVIDTRRKLENAEFKSDKNNSPTLDTWVLMLFIYTLFHEYCVIDTRRKLENEVFERSKETKK